MTLDQLIESMPDYARDIRLNLSSVLTEEGAPGLTSVQIGRIALAAAYAVREPDLVRALTRKFEPDEASVQAIKAAVAIMAMNNVYYRSKHLSEDTELADLPARLRMNVIGKPGIEKVDFELMCLAVSAIAGCGKCLGAHIHEVRKASVTNDGIHSAIRIAAVINAAAQARSISF